MKTVVNLVGILLVICLILTPMLHGYLRVHGPEFLAGNVVGWNGVQEAKGELTLTTIFAGIALAAGAITCFVTANQEGKK